jgi:putative transposase
MATGSGTPDTRAGTVELEIPKLRQGSEVPDWLLERRRRAVQALVTVVATSYLLGVSTRRVEQAGRDAWRDQAVEVAGQRDGQEPGRAGGRVSQTGRSHAGPYAFVWLDALTLKVRELALDRPGPRAAGRWRGRRRAARGAGPGRGQRPGRPPAGWRSCAAFLARGLAGVGLVTPGQHAGLVEAVGATLPGASWQRCRTHYARNLATEAPKSAQPRVLTLLRTVFDQPDAD